MDNVLSTLFGAKAQVIVGVIFTFTALSLWGIYTFVESPTIRVVFHISMLFGVAATYAIVATGLGFRATERVEAQITEVDVNTG